MARHLKRRISLTAVACSIAMAFAGNLQSMQPPKPAATLDHVILGIDDLARGVERFTAMTGVTPKIGGEHPGRGTHNALVSLGPGRYLEILAPTKAGTMDPRVKHAELTFAGFALGTRDIADVVRRLRGAGLAAGDPAPGARRTPDGALLQWKTAAPTRAGLALAPFFIEWSAETVHPSTTSPPGCTMTILELEQPETAQLQKLFDAVGFTISLRTGKTPLARIELNCPKGRVQFSS
jgi:hypothetical protein